MLSKRSRSSVDNFVWEYSVTGIVIASVPHSGTMLTADMFRNLDYNQRGFSKEPDSDKTMYIGHTITPEAMRAIEKLSETCRVVVPLRHPLRVANSWALRGKPAEQMVQAWENMMTIPDPVHIKIDADDRDEWVNAARFKLGLNIETDWPIINSKYDTAEIEMPEIMLGMEDLMQPLIEHYESVTL